MLAHHDQPGNEYDIDPMLMEGFTIEGKEVSLDLESAAEIIFVAEEVIAGAWGYVASDILRVDPARSDFGQEEWGRLRTWAFESFDPANKRVSELRKNPFDEPGHIDMMLKGDS